MKTRQNNDVTDRISLVYTELKLNCQNLFDRVWSMTKTRADNKVTDRTCAVYSENNNELL